MSKIKIVFSLVFLALLSGLCQAESDKSGHRDFLTDNLPVANKQLEDNGIETGIGVTHVYQANVKGGRDTHVRRGRYSGSYDLEISADLKKLLGFESGSIYIHAEGSWSKSGGIDAGAVGSAFGVNGDGASRRSIDVTEFWYERPFADEQLSVRIGKIDLTGGFECGGCPVAFDGSIYANDETGQFLNGAFVNNPTIPFPDNGIGFAVHYNPTEFWYASFGIADSQADSREIGFRTTFHKEDYFFYIFETGVAPQLSSENGPLQGTYRIGLWNDPQPKANSDSSKSYRDDTGFYTSCDQMVFKETPESEDNQGLGVFFRYGYAPSKTNDIVNFWSFGFAYQGIIDGRDDDVLGFGFAQGVFSNTADTTYNDDYENAIELYYNAQVTDGLNISPGIQYITNPGGDKTISDAVILGLRVQMNF